MVSARGEQGREQLKRRFGTRAASAREGFTPFTSRDGATTAAARDDMGWTARAAAVEIEPEFTLEDLFEPGGRGRAEAAIRFHRNKSAGKAVADLRRVVRELKEAGG